MHSTTTSKTTTRETPLRIGIDGRILMHYEMRGFARYAVELFRAMKEIAGGNIDLYSFSPGPIAPEFLAELDVTPVVFPARREILWEHVELPKHLRQRRIDIFHATGNRGIPYWHVCKYIVTCHDVIDRLPQYCGHERWRSRWRKKYADFVSVHSADKFITVSNFSKQDICSFYKLSPDRVAVIYNAAHQRFHQTVASVDAAVVRRKYALPDNYFLYLGGYDIKKNVAALVDAFKQLPGEAPSLVIAGEHKWGFRAVAERINALGLTDRILCPDGIADQDLPAIYQSALAFVYPSRYEGFGLQLVEAMASGVPVLASGTTSLPEVLDGCGLLFDPVDSASIARQMERVLRDHDLHRRLTDAGRRRANYFSWSQTAEETLKVYRSLLPSRQATPQLSRQSAFPRVL